MLGQSAWSDSTDHKWVVINTHPHKEHFALENLARQSFESYCPMLKRQVRHARKTRDVLRPMFPGYVFTAVSRDMQLWRPILSTFGVRSVVRMGDKLGFLPNSFIQSLKVREVDGVISKPISPYKIGQNVRMVAGPFEGLVATIIEMNDNDRLVVLMELLNRPVKVKVDIGSISDNTIAAR